jgi:hypothetical protein
MPSVKQPTGYVLYKGPSLINGKPIVVIAILGSDNVKTGNMVQTYILPDNGGLPVANARALEDEAVCGNCKHRRGLNGSCYVNLGQGVTVVTKSYLAGKYPESLPDATAKCTGRMVRLGTYGDPAAVPVHVWQSLLQNAKGWTGYTHQWASPKVDPALKTLCMASADNAHEFRLAQSFGWRTFRVRAENEPILTGEFMCPASKEAGKRKLCTECRACDGTDARGTTKASPAIMVHGPLKNRFIPVMAI